MLNQRFISATIGSINTVPIIIMETNQVISPIFTGADLNAQYIGGSIENSSCVALKPLRSHAFTLPPRQCH